MTRLVALALAFASAGACSKPPDQDNPIQPGGNPGTGTQFRPDAAATGDGGTMITGRVCLLLVDPQTLVTCATSGAGNITVTLGTQSTLTADDGSFTIMTPASTTDLTWFVSGAGVQKSAVKFGTTTTLPAIDAVEYQVMLASVDAPAGNSGIMLRVSRNGAPVPGAIVTIPTAESTIFYDGLTDTSWETDATGDFGVAWAPVVAPSTASAMVMVGAMQTTVDAIPVFPETLTFAIAVVP
jgi:hypothetical protein